jgi:outer membrane protein TolC
MKTHLLIGILFTATTLAAETPHEVTLDDAKKYAADHNFGVQALVEEVEQVDGKRIQARSRFFPKAGVAGGMDTEFSSGGNATQGMGYVYGNVNVFNGFKDGNDLKALGLDKQVAEAKVRRASFELGLEVERLYYLFLQKRKAVDIYDAALKINSTHQEMARKRRASGLVSDADVMEFELRASYLNSTKSAVNQEKNQARLSLVRLFGPELGTNIEPAGEVPHLHLKDDYRRFLERVRETSESIKISSLMDASASLQRKSAWADWMPKVDVEVQAGWMPLHERPVSGSSSEVHAMVLAKWDLFSGLETKGKIQETTAAARKAELELKQTVLSAMTEVEVLFSKLKSTAERVDVESENENRAQKYYAAVTGEYKRGIKNGADVKAAEENLLQARLRREELKYEFIADKLSIQKVLGVTVESETHSQPVNDKSQKKSQKK